MNFEMLVALAVFTNKAVTWSDVDRVIKAFARAGVEVPDDIQEAFAILEADLDHMLATAPPEVMGQA